MPLFQNMALITDPFTVEGVHNNNTSQSLARISVLSSAYFILAEVDVAILTR